MNAEQPSQRYSGVTWHAKKWLVKFRRNGRDLTIGHYEDPELAAWVSDFARYMCFGLNPANWHHRVGKPNGPPRLRNDFPRSLIVEKLLACGILSPKELQKRLNEFDAAVGKNAARCAHG